MVISYFKGTVGQTNSSPPDSCHICSVITVRADWKPRACLSRSRVGGWTSSASVGLSLLAHEAAEPFLPLIRVHTDEPSFDVETQPPPLPLQPVERRAIGGDRLGSEAAEDHPVDTRVLPQSGRDRGDRDSRGPVERKPIDAG